ncbi:MAG: inositol monophosphatase, partial [Bacteroidia bacterium]|nr:inositol monophosphatase [Bacteroidia bacterium]
MATNYLFDLKSELISLCQKTANFIRQEMDKVSLSDVEAKELNSLVSYVDKEAEKRIVTKLKALLPEAGFITEENTIHQEEKDVVWIVDPLDGTTNFLHRIPHFSISIALREQGEITLGIVFEIMHNKAYTAIKGFGAWEDEKTIRVKPTKQMD